MKILIVDDERMICEWLAHCIAQDQSCRLVGCAHNGEQALSLFETEKPDVVFTDIKMPVMDGITLLKRIKEQSFVTQVVLLTAYAEFDLVREAVRNGGDDYLLKTEMNHQSFQEVLQRLKQRLSRQESAGEAADVKRTDRQHVMVGNILRHRQVLEEEDLETLRQCNVGWRDEDLFGVALFKKNMLDGFSLPQRKEIRHLAGFEYDSLVYVAVGNLERNLSQSQKQQVLLEFAGQMVRENNCMVGISSLTHSLSQVGEVIGEAVWELSKGYYESKIRVYQSHCHPGQLKEDMITWETFMRAGRRRLHSLKGQAFTGFLDQVLSYARTNQVAPVVEVIEFCCEAMEEAAARYASEDGELMNRMLWEERKKAEQSDNMEQMAARVREFVETLMITEDLGNRKLSKGVGEAVEFVRSHYQEAISLEQVAEAVHLNSEYLSRIFKEETGCTYSMFLSQTRLKKAAYLLAHSPERVQKIARQVGYPNVSYFSTIFKKRYGVNPYEYRREEENGE